MKHEPLVSVVMPFFNTDPGFMREAIESVINQSYNNWELYLIDDGSEAPSSDLAIDYSNNYPKQVFYLAHPNHENRGASASRQKGIDESKGAYIAFLDSDDVWLTSKLAEQITILEDVPEANALYGNTLYWYSWTGVAFDANRDMMPSLGVPPNTLIQPPALLPLYVSGKAAVPCICSLIVHRDVFYQFGGFESSFHNINTDQILYAKIALNVPIYVSDSCWDWYRQHSGSSVATAKLTDRLTQSRIQFLNWLEDYIERQNIRDADIQRAIARELWRLDYPAWLPKNRRLGTSVRWIKKWLLRLDEGLSNSSSTNFRE